MQVGKAFSWVYPSPGLALFLRSPQRQISYLTFPLTFETAFGQQ
jgi:hypothetical protein